MNEPDPRPQRVVRDALGELRLPADALYGPQTARAAAWSFGGQRMPLSVVHAAARIKACAAFLHAAHERLPANLAQAIEQAALEVAAGRHDEQFVVDLFQTGSATSSHMNVNEVIAQRASQLLAGGNAATTVHPNDHVNLGQSSNDVMPSAVQIALVELGTRRLLPSLMAIIDRLHQLADRHWHDVRDGRTHLMRATPIRIGQQFRGYAGQLAQARERLTEAFDRCRELPLGGTAVGTGVGCPPGFASAVCAEFERRFGVRVRETAHHLGTQGCLDAITWLVAGVRSTASTLYKIANDLRWQASDALTVVELPTLQPGSSIMPGKVNPVVCEAVAMACAQIHGNDAVVGFANSQGQFELNTMIPVVARNALESVELLADSFAVLRTRCLDGLRVAAEVGRSVEFNPILATGLIAEIGYDRAAELARRAMQEGRTVLAVSRERTDLDPDLLAKLLDPTRLCGEFGRARPQQG